MSEGGMYALITKSEEYNSVVELFNRDFELINRYSYNGYVTDVAISEKGRYVATLVSKAEAGFFSTVVNVYEPQKDTLHAQCALGTGLGLRCGFTESENLAILCGDGVYYTTVGGKLISEYRFGGKNPIAFDLNKDGCVTVLRKNGNISENQVVAFGKQGETLYDDTMLLNVQSAGLRDENVFLMTTDGVHRIHAGTHESAFLPSVTENKVMLVTEEDRVILCSPQKAVYYKILF